MKKTEYGYCDAVRISKDVKYRMKVLNGWYDGVREAYQLLHTYGIDTEELEQQAMAEYYEKKHKLERIREICHEIMDKGDKSVWAKVGEHE